MGDIEQHDQVALPIGYTRAANIGYTVTAAQPVSQSLAAEWGWGVTQEGRY